MVDGKGGGLYDEHKKALPKKKLR